jgi:hypothetical protein
MLISAGLALLIVLAMHRVAPRPQTEGAA